MKNIQLVSNLFWGSRPNQNRILLGLNVILLLFGVSPSKSIGSETQRWSVISANSFSLAALIIKISSKKKNVQTPIIKIGLCFSELFGNYKLVLGVIWILCSGRKSAYGRPPGKVSRTVIFLFSLQECSTVSIIIIIIIFWNSLFPLGFIVLIFFFELVSQSLATMRKTFSLTGLC